METHEKNNRREQMGPGQTYERMRPAGTPADDLLDWWIARGYGPGILKRWQELPSRELRRGMPSA